MSTLNDGIRLVLDNLRDIKGKSVRDKLAEAQRLGYIDKSGIVAIVRAMLEEEIKGDIVVTETT